MVLDLSLFSSSNAQTLDKLRKNVQNRYGDPVDVDHVMTYDKLYKDQLKIVEQLKWERKRITNSCCWSDMNVVKLVSQEETYKSGDDDDVKRRVTYADVCASNTSRGVTLTKTATKTATTETITTANALTHYRRGRADPPVQDKNAASGGNGYVVCKGIVGAQRRCYEPTETDDYSKVMVAKNKSKNSYREEYDLLAHKLNCEERLLKVIDERRTDALRKIGNLLHHEVTVSNDKYKSELIRIWPAEESSPSKKATMMATMMVMMMRNFKCEGKDDNGQPLDAKSSSSPSSSPPAAAVVSLTTRTHVDLLTMIGGMDGEDRGSAIGGSRGYVLLGPAVFLQQSLVQYAVRFLSQQQRGYQPICPPPWMCKALMGQVRMGVKVDEASLYRVALGFTHQAEDEKFLIEKLEQPLAAFHQHAHFLPEELPIKYAGVSVCFQKQTEDLSAESVAQRENRGIFRTNYCQKVDQFVICKPDESWLYFHEMIRNAQDFYESLGIAYKVVRAVSGAMAHSAAMQYNLEAWFPGSRKYEDLVSVSNCTDYQSRDLGIRFSDENGKKEYPHMITGNLVNIERTICALLEVHQTSDGITIPEPLREFMPSAYQTRIPFKYNPFPKTRGNF